MGKNEKTIGGEIIDRLRRFTETLEQVEDQLCERLGAGEERSSGTSLPDFGRDEARYHVVEKSDS